MTKRAKKLLKMVEMITFTVIMTSIDLISFFSGHYVLAFITTLVACIGAHQAIKAVISYLDEPQIVVTKTVFDEKEKDFDIK